MKFRIFEAKLLVISVAIFIIILSTALFLLSIFKENIKKEFYRGFHEGYIKGLSHGYREGYDLSCIENNFPKIVEKEGVIIRSFDFEDYIINVRISTRKYFYYKFRDGESLSEYITPNESEIKELALTLRKIYPDDEDFARACLKIVHQIKYEEDITVFNVKFPVETLAEGSGDCEDLAILLVSLLRAGGLNATLVVFDKHVGCAVHLEELKKIPKKGAFFFEYDGKKFYYCEPQEGFDVGEMPDKYINASAKLMF